MFKLTPFVMVLLITTAINIVISYISWQRSKIKGGIYFALAVTGITLWTLAAALDYAAVPLAAKIIFAKLEAVGYHSAITLFALFSISYAGNDHWLKKKWIKALFLFIPLSNILLTVTNEFHHLIWTGFVQKATNVVVFEHGPAFNWGIVTNYSLVIFMFINLWTASRTGSDLARRQARILMFALLFPVAANLLYQLGAGHSEGIDWTSITFSVSGFLFLYALHGIRLLDIVPIAHDKLVSSLGDGMIVIDLQNRIIDINQIAESMLESPPKGLVGKSLADVAPLAQSLTGQAPELEIRTELETGSDTKRYFDVLVSPLREGQTYIGRLIIFRDITERKQMDKTLQYRTKVLEALQQVMLDLVNRHEVDDILQTLLIKIGALLDVPYASIDLIENNDTLVTYAATAGQPLNVGDRMKRGEGGWLSWQAVDSGEPTVLEDYSSWEKRRDLYEAFPIHAVLLIPIKNNERVIGVINFLRNEINKPFNELDVYTARQLVQMAALVLDNAQLYTQLQYKLAESVQREILLSEVQNYVVDQQRTLAMIDERQRMARDLHDSVNQSIHSLVLFSETLVSMLDKNKLDRARQISERLQESARQALKETRLLLYETQAAVKGRGVNLIEELHARLASVELRAGVRAEIVEEGSLTYWPAEWQENLLWITIEALNNALKHAQARSVRILIRSFPKFLELEVADDGRGFDATRPDAGGYGLRNMQERASLLGGMLTFSAIIPNGTRVLFRAEQAQVKE